MSAATARRTSSDSANKNACGFASTRETASVNVCDLTSLYAEKLLPQPQLLTAFGLLNVKPRFSRPS
jgi:hypothetical protein